jgi:hypothetical protein
MKKNNKPQNPYRCSDGHCVLLVRTRFIGMSTNGGCRCSRQMTTSNPSLEHLGVFLQGIRWLTSEIESGDKIEELSAELVNPPLDTDCSGGYDGGMSFGPEAFDLQNNDFLCKAINLKTCGYGI